MSSERIQKQPQETTIANLGSAKREDINDGLANDFLWGPSLTDSRKFYESLENSTLKPHVFLSDEGTTYYHVDGPMLDGGGINALLYFAAPYKHFGFDTADILNDWEEIYSSYNQHILHGHQGMQDWDLAIKHIKLFREAIERWDQRTLKTYNAYSHPSQNIFLPVVQWKKTINGNRDWLIYPDPHPPINPLLGIYLTATFSYDVTKDWPKRKGYEPGGYEQNMGATQSVLLAVQERNSLFNSIFFQNLESYIDQSVSREEI